MGCAASSRQNDPAAKPAGNKKKDKGKDKAGKEEDEIQATLEPDEVINCFNDLDDQDVGLKLIAEKEPELIKDIKMTNSYFTDLEAAINKEVVFPDTQEHLKTLYDKSFSILEKTEEGVPEEEKRKLSKNFMHKHNIQFTTQELKVFTEAEVYHPLLSKNKHEYIKLIFKQVKNFVGSLKAHKKLIYEPCRTYLIENQKKYGVGTLLDRFQVELSKSSNGSKYWITEATKADDHVLDAYNIFDHNMNVLVKLVLIFYEKCNMEYQVLSKPENKINYNILVNNFLYWSITNLERQNFPVYKLYLSELSRLNHLLNQKIGKSRLIELIFKYRGESYTFFQNLKEIKIDIEKNLFGVLKNNGTVLHKPLKEKFNHNFKVLIQETLPTIYDKYDKIKDQVEAEVRGHLGDFFNVSPPFNFRVITKFDKSIDEKKVGQYLMNMYTVIMYIQAEIFKTKFNLDPEHYKRRVIRIYEMFGIQLNESQLEDLKSLKDSIIAETNYSATFDSLQADAEKIIKDYNTKKINRELHVYVLCSFFLCLSGLELRREGTRYVYKQNEYLSDSRYILFKLANRMRNFDFAMSNWTLINYMEYKIEDFLEEYSSKVQTQAETKLLQKLRHGKVDEVVKSLHGEMERLDAYLKFSMDQDFDSKDTETFDIQKALNNFKNNPEYFFSFKPMFAAESGTNSRHINIFISSFLNQAEDPQELWKDYCKGEPYAENYSFVWPTMDTFGYNEIKIQMEQEYKDNNVKSDLFHMGVNLLANNHTKAIKLEKLDMNPFYGNLYYMAMISGKALAFFIGQLRMFETSTITLIGFSMGAVVAYNCLRDLYYMRKSNLIYNFVTIASPLGKAQLNPEIVKLSMGSCFNIFSMDDKVLKYLSSMIPYFQNPVGLNELVYDGALYSAKKIKVMNFDMTSMVHCHMDYLRFLKNIVEFVKQSDKYKTVQDFLFS